MNQSNIGRRYAIADVHGCIKTLRKLVEDVIKFTKDDTLILLGDFIDRGPDSKAVLDYLLSLLKANYNIRPIRGNHEQLALDAYADPSKEKIWLGNDGGRTLKQLTAYSVVDIPKKYIEFMAALPRIIVENEFVFVHACLDFNTNNPIYETDPMVMLWGRDCRVEPDKLFGKTLVCGHNKKYLFEIQKSVEAGQKIICLDNGCFSKGEIGFGNMVALNLETNELLVLENCE